MVYHKRLFIFLFSLTYLWAAEPVNKQYHGPIYKSLTSPVEHVIWDGNQISSVHGNHGDDASYHVTGNSGLEWPKGSGKLAVFQSGIWLASGRSKAPGGAWVDELRTAAAEYTVEFVPGSIGSDDSNSGKIYQIQKKEVEAFLDNDWATFDAITMELPVSTLEGTSLFTEMVETDLPSSDFINWPVHDGAPWVDVDGDGVYDPENDGDYPEILGDMFHWHVMNDGDAATHTPLWGTPPMNVDVQTSMFGFDQAGAMGNIMFLRWVIINKGSDELDSVFVAMWHDDDLGDATDDLVGCNTDLSVGYTYNDTDGDNTYGVEAPAAGGDFFQGPIVNSPGDTATILTWGQGKGYYLRKFPDMKKLGLTSFAKYINGNPNFSDPETAEETFRYMNGLVGNTGDPYVDPTTNEPSVFVHNGDPVTGVGWIDDVPGDRRYLMSSGPFYLAPGDTQEVVGAMIIAAGSNWAKSITKMLYFDNFAQGAFDANFNVCSPPSPSIELAQLDQKVILTFEENSDVMESYNCASYSFQGYNVYQGASLNGPWTRIKTYDVVDDIKTIMDLTLDEDTGELLELPAQFGTDSGLNHYVEITYDAINSRSIINHRKYYFAVTAYAYDPDAAQRVIESPINAIEAVPGGPGLGNALASGFSDTLAITHTGLSDAVFLPHVVDPYKLTNHDYEISFDIVDSVYHWYLTDTDDNELVGQDTLFPATPDYYDYANSDLEFADLPDYYENVEIMDGFILGSKNATYAAPSGYATATTTVDADTSTSLVFGGLNATGSGTWVEFIESLEPNGVAQAESTPGAELLQLDLKVVFSDEGSIASFFNVGGLIGGTADTTWVPFEMYTVEDNRRVDIAVYLAAGSKPLYELDEDNPGSKMFAKNMYFIPVYRDYTGTMLNNHYSDGGIMGWMTSFNKSSTSFESGNEFLVTFKNPIIPGTDTYTFTGKGMQSANADSALTFINVFPNPYFGKNPEERNQLNRFVYFTNLGVGTTTIRIFTIAGDMIAKIEKEITAVNDPDRRAQWDLRNSAGIPVASGMYIAHIDVEGVGEKVLKLAVFMPEERLDVY
jgi:hypothetical protein